MLDPGRTTPSSFEALDLSSELRASLELLRSDIAAAAGTNLAGLILYGGLARGRYHPGKSDVNIVVLLHDTSTESLAKVAPLLRQAWRSSWVEPFIVRPSEIGQLAETFPTKLLDIQEHHVVLLGEDPFAGLEISREQIRLRIQQGLRNIALRLRRRYVSIYDDPAALAEALRRIVVPLKVELGALMRLSGKDAPSASGSAAVLSAAALAFDLDGEALAQLASLRNETELNEDVSKLYDRVLAAIARAAEIAASVE
jgi:hypothetical protein